VSTDELRRELDRIADMAPAADVADDTWSRARRSVVRDRAVVAAAGLVVAAAVAAGVTWLPQRADPPVADTNSGAIPSKIWTLPDDVNLPLYTVARVGMLSAVYLRVSYETDRPDELIAVSATDGTYRSLRLKDANGLDAVTLGFDKQTFELSPDGRQLAYAYLPSQGLPGVAVADLVAGTVRFVPLDIGNRGIVRRLIWSPGGQFLIWWGQPHTSQGFGDTMAGLIGPGATTSTTLPKERQDESRGYAVDDNGRVALIDQNRIRIWQDGRIVDAIRVDLGSTSSRSAQLVDEGVVEVRTGYASDDATGDALALVVRHDGAGVQSAPFPSTLYRWSVLGWTKDGAAIVEADPLNGSTIEPEVYQVELTGAGDVTHERIISLESSNGPGALTLATDLPVEEFDAPEWAEEPWWGIDPSLLIGLGVAAGITAVMGLRWGWRRYRAAR
jgi:hypothetical protein